VAGVVSPDIAREEIGVLMAGGGADATTEEASA